MENREITIEELEIGDEILTLTQQGKYLKVLEKPRLSKQKGWGGRDKYIAVKCRVNVDVQKMRGNRYSTKAKAVVPYTYDSKSYNIKAPEDDSPIEKFDLNYKKIWLVKREI